MQGPGTVCDDKIIVSPPTLLTFWCFFFQVYSARGYPEGPSQLIPLLIAVLPGIDSNDTGKSALIFHFLNKVCHLVPLVDCSAALQDPVLADSLTEEEKVVCGQTTQFEDFVLQFLDRYSSAYSGTV